MARSSPLPQPVESPSWRAAVAQVSADSPDGGVRGTAFLIAPRYALTALHVVADRHATPPLAFHSIRLHFGASVVAAQVVPSACDGQADWALLALATEPVDAGGQPILPLPLLELTEEALSDTQVQWRSCGFPEAKPDGLDVAGEVRTTQAQVGGQRALQLFSAEAAAGAGAPVSGLSGAPVVVDGAVAGLLRWATLDGEGRSVAGALFACPIATVLASLQAQSLPDLQLVQPRCPYPGLVPFSKDKASWFFGRSAEIAWLQQHLRKQRFVLVVGPSGSGKSSLVQAGLLPKLGPELPAQVLRPGATPQASLDQALRSQPVTDTPAPPRLLLFIDQLEELFTRHDRATQRSFCQRLQELRQDDRYTLVLALRADFYPDLMSSQLWPIDPGQRLEVAPLRGEALAAAITEPAARVGISVQPALRERLLADAADEPGVLPLLQETLVLLWEKRVGRQLTLAAYQELATEALPPGSRRDAPHSGLMIAVARHAEAVLSQLPDLHLARRTLLRLTQFGEGRPNTRRQLPLSQLRAADDAPHALDALIARLVDARLLTATQPDALPTTEPAPRAQLAEPMIDLAHEAMLGSWPRLKTWISELRHSERVRRRLEDYARERERLRQQGGGLLDPVETQEAEAWLKSPDGHELGVSEAVRALVSESHAALQKAEQARLAAERAKSEQALLLLQERVAAQTRVWRAVALMLLVVALVTAVFGGLAFVASDRARTAQKEASRESQRAHAEAARAQKQAQLATARSLATLATERAESTPDQALLLAVSALRLHDSAETQGALLRALLQRPQVTLQLHGHLSEVRAIALSPDGSLLASGGADGSLRLWNALTGAPLSDASGRLIASQFGAEIRTLAFTSDGARVLVAGAKPELGVVQTQGPKLGQQTLSPLLAHTGELQALAVSKSGKLFATGADDQQVILWDAVTGLQVGPRLNGHQGAVRAVAFSDDGLLLASGGDDKTVRLWDTRSGQPVGPVLRGANDSVRAVVFSPDGTRLAVGGLDNKVRLWDVKTKQPLGTPLEGHKSAITSLQFLPDGQHLLSASWDATVLLWGLSSPKPLQKLRGTGYLFGLALTPDGQSVFVAGADRALMRFSLSGESPLQRAATTPGRELTSVAMSPDGQALAAGSWDQAVHVWTRQKSATGEQLVPESTLTGHSASVDAVAFSPDGKLIASGSYDHLVRVWNRAQKSEAFAPLSGHSAGVAAVVFSPDGTRLASGGFEGSIQLWDPQQGKAASAKLQGHGLGVLGLSYSADGKWLCSASQDQTVRLWDAHTGHSLCEPQRVHKLAVSSCAFSPDGKLLLAGGEDDLLRVFAITSDGAGKLTLTAQGEPLLGHRDRITQVTVLPGGQRALTSSEDRTLRLWDLRSLSPIHTALSGHHQVVRGIATSPQAPGLAASVGHDGALRLWDLDPASWAQLACIRAGRDLSQTERAQFLPSDSSLVVCPQK